MSNSDSLFDDDSIEMDSFPGEPSEELLRESKESFENLSDMDGLGDVADTPDAALEKSEALADSADEIAGEEAVPAEAAAIAAAAVTEEKKDRFNIDWAELTIFDAILVVSLVFISLATLMLFFELRQFGNFPFGGFPWRTDGF